MNTTNTSQNAIGNTIIWSDAPLFTVKMPKKKGNVTNMKQKVIRTLRNVIRAAAGSEFLRRMVKKYGLAAAALLFLYGWTAIACAITANNVEKETAERVRAEVTSELRAGFQNYLDGQELQEKREQFLTGEESFEAAVDDLAGPMAQVIETYAMDFGVTEEGQKTIGWVFCSRHAKNSTEFGKTPQEILEKAGAWEGNVVGHATRPAAKELSKQIARDYLSGNWPDGYTTDLTFFNREPGGKIIARNELKTGPYTVYWFFGK